MSRTVTCDLEHNDSTLNIHPATTSVSIDRYGIFRIEGVPVRADLISYLLSHRKRNEGV